MSNKSFFLMAGAAVILGGAAYLLSSDAKGSAPKLNGASVVTGLDVANVASVDFGTKLKLVSDAAGWKVASYHGYPASREKLTENLIKLTELKVGQVVRGKKLDGAAELVLKDAAGAELVKLSLGEKHPKWGHGRYAAYKGETVLLSDTLDAFDGDGKSFVETKIVDEPWISFNDIAENVSAADLGFATGVVAKVTIGGDTNRTITVGNVVKGGSDRYVKLDKGDWVYTVSSYSVEKFLPKPEPKPETKAEPKAEAKPAAPKAEAKPAASETELKKVLKLEPKPTATAGKPIEG